MSKNILIHIGEAIERYRAEREEEKATATASATIAPQKPNKLSRLVRWLLPNGGTLLIVLFLIATQSVWSLPLRSPSATSTSTISYQGRLADTAGEPLTGMYNMVFRIYDVPTGGSPLWEENWVTGNSVEVSDGLFNVMLGSINNTLAGTIAGHDELYLGIAVGTDNEMTPRVQLGSVPFSIQAMTVADGSVTTEKIADGAVSSAWYVAPLSDAILEAGTSDWVDVRDTTITFELEEEAVVFATYSINVQADSEPDDEYVATRLMVDGTPYQGTASHFQPYTGNDSNVNLNGNLVVTLPAGTHTVKLQWKEFWDNTVTWSSDPSWGDGYVAGRTITVLAFYK